jgi:hypothetical protein
MQTETAIASSSRFAAHAVTRLDDLRAIIGEPSRMIAEKGAGYLTPLVTQFIETSPYFMLATAAADGTCDVSPRGDAAGNVHILDERTIVLPDRLGNKRVDSLKNILCNPHVGLLFLIPGVDETVRLNGRATLSRDPGLLAALEMRGKQPNVVIVVEIEEVFTHCARSVLRSGVWAPETWVDPDTVPTLAAMSAEQKHLPPPDESAGKRNEEYRTRLY